jgi:hypothetical protein
MKTEIPDNEPVTGEYLFAIRSDGLSFLQCVEGVMDTPPLMAQIDRLQGTSFTKPRAPIEKMIDEATGKDAADLQTLLRFVWNCIFTRVSLGPPVLTTAPDNQPA